MNIYVVSGHLLGDLLPMVHVGGGHKYLGTNLVNLPSSYALAWIGVPPVVCPVKPVACCLGINMCFVLRS